MPELPEVEIVRTILSEQIIGKTIDDIKITYPKIIRTPADSEQFKLLLIGKRLDAINRRGKYLLFVFDDITLVSHLRMEGKYLYLDQEASLNLVNKHTHVIFSFTDGTELHYQDVRKFGTMDLVWNQELANFPALAKLGQEPIAEDFDAEDFAKRLQGRSCTIKQALLNQEIVSGLGNIYVDDSLAKSGISPLKPARDLTAAEIQRLVPTMREILEEAIRYGGSTIKSFETIYGKGSMQDHLLVYGQTGKPCFRCGTPIEKIKLAGRGTHYCPSCQRL